MKKSDLEELRALYKKFTLQHITACACKDWQEAEAYKAKAIAVCEVLAALDGIPYTAAVDKIIENYCPFCHSL